MTDTMRRIYQRQDRARRHFETQSGRLMDLQYRQLRQCLVFYDLRRPGQ